jgi:catechol 2,3-dioxygenase-like lactoylglutathione lyase family enzyme
MFDHISLGVRDLQRSRRFYDSALCFTPLSIGDDWLGYGGQAVALWLAPSASPPPLDPRSGLHFCFKGPSRAAVDEFHRAGLAAGGRDNGAPGLRADYGLAYYAAYVVDPDGYRLEALYNQET